MFLYCPELTFLCSAMAARILRVGALVVVAFVAGLTTQVVLAEAGQQQLVGEAEVGSACHELTSCGDCKSATLCHWCSDQQCHAIGSIHG